MRIDFPVSATVWVQGRGQVQILELMKEASIPHAQVGFPKREYRLPNGVALICGHPGKNYERFDLRMRGADGIEVTGREPIPYVEVYSDLYSYEEGALESWSEKHRTRKPTFPKGYKLFQVLGRSAGRRDLRVKLPHRSDEWILKSTYVWLDRQPSPLEVRLQQLWLERPFHSSGQHPLASAGHLVDYARKERNLLTVDGAPYNVLAVEDWEELRQEHELSIDEALVAIWQGLLSAMEDRGRTYYGGPFETDLLEQYRKATWSKRDPQEFLEQMGDLYTIEREMLTAAMRAVAATRALYARQAFDQLMGDSPGPGESV